MMDPQSKAMLDEILAKEPAALTDGDKAFLKARRSYLNTEQKAVYAQVLSEQPEGQEDCSESNSESSKGRKSDEQEAV